MGNITVKARKAQSKIRRLDTEPSPSSSSSTSSTALIAQQHPRINSTDITFAVDHALREQQRQAQAEPQPQPQCQRQGKNQTFLEYQAQQDAAQCQRWARRIIQIPQPRRDADGDIIIPAGPDEHELNAATLQRALGLMADYIGDARKKNESSSPRRHPQQEQQQPPHPVTIIVVGGAVNVLLLKNRSTTLDVDMVATTNHTPAQQELLAAAAVYAEKKCLPHTPLGWRWFNNDVSMGMDEELLATITRESVEQNEVIFQRKELKVLAANWEYAFAGKLGKMSYGDARGQWEAGDAVAYLRRWLVRRNRVAQGLELEVLKGWAEKYEKLANPVDVSIIARRYREVYGTVGLVLPCKEGGGEKGGVAKRGGGWKGSWKKKSEGVRG